MKTGVGQLTEGSNPSPSARLVIQPTIVGFLLCYNYHMQDSGQYPNLNGNQSDELSQSSLNQANSQQPYSPPSSIQLQSTFPVSNTATNNQQPTIGNSTHAQATQTSTLNQNTSPSVSSDQDNGQSTSDGGSNHTDYHQSVEEQLPQIEPISWTASESVSQQRSGKWYGVLTAIFLVLLIGDVLLFIFHVMDLMTVICFGVLVVAMFIAILGSTKIPSHEISYVLSGEGISINGQVRHFDEFRAFGVRKHGGLWQLVLIPVKRFGMEIVSYIDEQHGERIIDILASFLPMEEVPENSVDKLIDRLKI